MENKESIFNYIEKNIQRNGKLSDKFDLSIYKNMETNGLKFADGMVDFCLKAEEDNQVLKLLVSTLENLEDVEENLTISLINIDNYYANNPNKTILATIDNFLQLIIEDSKNPIHQYSAPLIHKWALYMILFGKEIETVKIGIALIGLFPLEENDSIIELLEKLSLCEEFTKYTSIALNNAPNSNEIKFRLAKKLSSYGKIILVNDLEPNTEEIQEWLLCDGCSNDASEGWLALNIARKIDLPKMIHDRVLSEDEFGGLYNIVQALIEEGPQEGISVYEQKEELFTEIANQYEHLKNNLLYIDLLAIIKAYCDKEDKNSNAFLKIKEIINSNETKKFIIDEIEKENNITECTYICRQIDNFDVYKNVFEVFKKNPKKNIDCIGYLFENTKNVDEIIDILSRAIDLDEAKGEPEPRIEFGESLDLISIIQYLADFPSKGEEFIIAGLNSKTMHPRNASLRAIYSWKKKIGLNSLSQTIKDELLKLKDKEIIKSYKEMINEILDINEDLSNYQEPQIIYGTQKEGSTGINIFDGDIDSLFTDTIIYRGKDYFENNMILNCELSKSKFISYVQGTNFSNEYKVTISINNENEITDMECTCPYPYNCKHEYATLLKIRDKYGKEKQ